MSKFRKKPIVIEAFQWVGGDATVLELRLGHNWGRADAKDVAWPFADDNEHVVIYNSLERVWIPCPVTAWIIQGVRGEYYPCDDTVFKMTYKAVGEDE